MSLHGWTRTHGWLALGLMAAALAGCSSTTTVAFRCDAVVNEGLLLTIDLVQVNEGEAAQIRQEGARWFYSPLRQQLALRTRTLAVKGGCTQSVSLTPQKGYEILAIIADYRTAPSDRVEGLMQFRTRKEWKGQSLEVLVRSAYSDGPGSPLGPRGGSVRVHPDIHWSEGMLLRPQHLQVAARNLGGKAIDSARMANPFLWGFEELEIADDLLEGFTFGLRRATAVLKDGTFLQLASNLRLSPRDIKDALAMSDGRLQVWLGLPRRRDGEPNAVDPALGLSGQDRRWVVETQEVPDENSGIPGQPVAVRKLSGRFFLGTESREGYECLPVAVIQRGGAGSSKPSPGPRVHPAGYRPGRLAAARRARGVGAPPRRGQAPLPAGRGDGGPSSSSTPPTRRAGRPSSSSRSSAGSCQWSGSSSAAPGSTPSPAYLELARLAGELAIFEEGGVESVADSGLRPRPAR